MCPRFQSPSTQHNWYPAALWRTHMLLLFSTFPWPSIHLFGSRLKTLCSPWLGNTHNLFHLSTYKQHVFPVTSLRVDFSSAVRSKQDKKMQVNIWYCFLFIPLTLLPKRTSSFDHFADNILQSPLIHKSKGVRESRWDERCRVTMLQFNVHLERQKSKNLNKISLSYMSEMQVKMINSFINCQATVKLWLAPSNCAKTQMTFASKPLKAANQKLRLHRDAASLAEQRIKQLAASAAIFTFYTTALFRNNFLLFDFWIRDDGNQVHIYVANVC